MPGVQDNGKYPHAKGEKATAYKHGFYVVKKAISRKIDMRTVAGRALVQWRAQLVADLGGDVTTAQGQMIDLACRSKLLLDSIDAWLLAQPSLVNRHKKSLLPVVRERQALADGLAKYLMALGLHRQQREQTLEQLLDED